MQKAARLISSIGRPEQGEYHMKPEEIAPALEALKQDVDKLTNAAMKRLAVETADERIAAWEKRRLSVIIVILAIFGIASYAALTDKVANYFVESINS